MDRDTLRTHQTNLAVALANSLQPVSLFEPKAPSHLHIGAHASSGDPTTITVERFGLGEWLSTLLPQFKPGEYHTLQSRLKEETSLHMDKDVRFLLSKMLGVGLTTDGFQSQSRLYFHSLTAHGIVMYRHRPMFLSFLLRDEAFPDGTAQGEADFVTNVCAEYELDVSKRVGMTVDGAERATARALNLPYLWCPAHLLNLAIHDVLKWPEANSVRVAVDDLAAYPRFSHQGWELMDKFKKTVRHFSSRTAWAELEKAAAQLQDPGEKSKPTVPKMKTDVETRWKSELDCGTSVLESSAAQHEYWRSAARRGVAPILSSIDEKLGNELAFVLSGPAHITSSIQGWAYPTGIDVIPQLIRCIEFWLTKATDVIIQTALVQEIRDSLVNSHFVRAWAKSFARASGSFLPYLALVRGHGQLLVLIGIWLCYGTRHAIFVLFWIYLVPSLWKQSMATSSAVSSNLHLCI